MDHALPATVVELLRQHQPWLFDKLGGAIATQSVRELWEYLKLKLGTSETIKVETTPTEAQWELFRAKLLLAIENDAELEDKLRRLALEAGPSSTNIGQHAEGVGHKQVSVAGSRDVKIKQ